MRNILDWTTSLEAWPSSANVCIRSAAALRDSPRVCRLSNMLCWLDRPQWVASGLRKLTTIPSTNKCTLTVCMHRMAPSHTNKLLMQLLISVRILRLAISAALLMPWTSAVSLAQSQLPSPSRTIYKCNMKGTVSYSDEPCVGAKRLDATLTRGVDHLSGKIRVGKDVAAEIHTEQFADALRPLHGMSTSQFATMARRNNLEPAAQRECRALEPAILGLEKAEKSSDAALIKRVQQDLFILRKRYKSLAC